MDKTTRLYAQLQPDKAGREHLMQAQAMLPAQTRGHAVAERQLHVTLIHFGNVRDIYADMLSFCDVTYHDYSCYLTDYITHTQALLQGYSCTLQPKGLMRFGPSDRTLVVEFAATNELIELHQKLLLELRAFIARCGIMDADQFIAQSKNLAHSASLRPHVALYKGYNGMLPELNLRAVTYKTMKLIF